MLTTSNQLKAARALIGLGQIALAERAALNVNTIRKMEAGGSGPVPGLSVNVQAVQRVLEEAGVEFLSGDQPGVRISRTNTQMRDVVEKNSDRISINSNKQVESTRL